MSYLIKLAGHNEIIFVFIITLLPTYSYRGMNINFRSLKNLFIAVLLAFALHSSPTNAAGVMAKSIVRGLKEGVGVFKKILVFLGTSKRTADLLAPSILNSSKILFGSKALSSKPDLKFFRGLIEATGDKQLMKLLNEDMIGEKEIIEINNKLFKLSKAMKAADRSGLAFGNVCSACYQRFIDREFSKGAGAAIEGIVVDLPPWVKKTAGNMPSTEMGVRQEITLLAKKTNLKNLYPTTVLEQNIHPRYHKDLLLFLRLKDSSDPDARRFYKSYMEFATVPGHGTKIYGHNPSEYNTMWKVVLNDLDPGNEAAARETLNSWSDFFDSVVKKTPDGDWRSGQVVHEFQLRICNGLEVGNKSLLMYGKKLQDEEGCFGKIFSNLISSLDCDDMRESGLLIRK
ncbi:MAG: hypothetical protein ISR65_07600 [Bacteriovoracaceae bacterium]|nr:hypothetical protein [Bacteriovoracaceae bacterium]